MNSEEQKYRGNGENDLTAGPGYHGHDRSPAEIERDIERTRGNMDRTLDALLQKLTPGQLMDEALSRMKTGGAREFADNLGHSVKNNPIPIALVGVGLGWLMMGGQRHGTPSRPHVRARGVPDAIPASRAAGIHSTSETGGAAKERMGAWSESAKSKYEDVKTRGAAAVQGVREKASEASARASAAGHAAKERIAASGEVAAERMRHGYETASDMAYEGAALVRDQFNRLLAEQPLVLVGLGVALGATLGAALPRTRREDRWMGEARDEALAAAQTAGEEVARAVGDTAAAARDAAAAEAKRQGLTVEEAERRARELAEKGKSVAEAGRTAISEEAERQGLTRAHAAEAVRQAGDKIEAVAKAAKEAAQREAEHHGASTRPEEMKARVEAAAASKPGGRP